MAGVDPFHCCLVLPQLRNFVKDKGLEIKRCRNESWLRGFLT
jgi:hypothetical protein